MHSTYIYVCVCVCVCVCVYKAYRVIIACYAITKFIGPKFVPSIRENSPIFNQLLGGGDVASSGGKIGI